MVAHATPHEPHHDELGQQIAKCDEKAVRHDHTKNSGAGSVVDEAVILEMFSKRSIPQLRLAFCSYKHIYGHDYSKASRHKQLPDGIYAMTLFLGCHATLYLCRL